MRLHVLAVTAIAAIASALPACNPDFAPQYLVQDLRILGARAQVVAPVASFNSDADAGDVVRLDALVANPQGEPVTLSWRACLPEVGQAVPPCLDPAFLRDPSRLDGQPGVVDLGDGPCSDASCGVVVPIPSSVSTVLATLIARAEAQPAYACTLYAELPVVIIARSPSSQQVAVKRVRLTPYRELAGTTLENAYVPNLNPGFASVSVSQDPERCDATTSALLQPCASANDCASGVTCQTAAGATGGMCGYLLPAGEHALCATSDVALEQTFNRCDPDGTRLPYVESFSYQWYTTGGSFRRSSSSVGADAGNATGEAVSFTPPAGPFTLWVIVRDGRGGEDWLRRDFP